MILRRWLRWLRTASQRWARPARRAADLFPLTPLGILLVCGASVAFLRFGHGKFDLVLLVVGYALLGIALLCLLAVCIGTAVVWLRLRRIPQDDNHLLKTETERLTHIASFALPALRWLPLAQVESAWLSVADARVELERAGDALEERVRLGRRGEITQLLRRVVVQDAFGIARIGLRHRQDVTIDVWPHIGRLANTEALLSMASGEEHPHPLGVEDGDRVEIRRYVAGDPARFIHWKAFARTRKLMVRMPERALSRARRTVAYQVAADFDEASAAAARAALEGHALGDDWSFAADGSPGATTRVDEALRKIARSADAAERHAAGLQAFLQETDRMGPAALVVFAPPMAGPWVGRLEAVVKRRPGRARVVMGVDGVRDVVNEASWQRWLLLPAHPKGATPAQLEHVSQLLRALGCEYVFVDRASGRVFGDVARLIGQARRAA